MEEILIKDVTGNSSIQMDFASAFARDVKWGLSQSRKSIPQEYIYDEYGSDNFQKTMHTQWYYIPPCERQMLDLSRSSIIGKLDRDFNLVDLGAGDGSKTHFLIQQAAKQEKELHYVPIDISKDSNETLANMLTKRFPGIKATILTGRYEEGLHYINASKELQRQSLLLFLGSTIGNFTRSGAEHFLMTLHSAMKSSDFLLTVFDMPNKDYKTILEGYDDPDKMGYYFYMNVLTRLNRELGGEFDMEKFFYHGYIDPYECCVRHTLVSRVEQTVKVKATGKSFHFEECEPILVQQSHKYTMKDIRELAKRCGFSVEAEYFDEKKYLVFGIWLIISLSLWLANESIPPQLHQGSLDGPPACPSVCPSCSQCHVPSPFTKSEALDGPVKSPRLSPPRLIGTNPPPAVHRCPALSKKC